MDKFIDVGQIVNTHGLRGEVKVNPRTDTPEVFEIFEYLYTEDKKEYKVEGVRYQKNCVLLKLSGINDMDSAERMRNKILYVPRELFEDLPEDTFLVADISGLELKDENMVYGKITDVISTGSNDVYEVKPPVGKNIYVPAIKDVVKEINVDGGYVLVEIPKGLLD